MTRKLRNVAAALAVGFVMVIGAGAATLEEVPSIKEIMGKLNKGPDSLVQSLKKDLEADPIDWNVVQDKTEEIAKYAGYMPKNEPPQGDKESWAAITKKYAGTAEKLAKAAKEKDLEAVTKAHGTMLKACAKCHMEFKP